MADQSPYVSIIIPCYRQARFVADAVESALRQSFRSVEVIVVNDGSDDDTEQVLAPFRPSFRYLYQENRGVSAARNAGATAATGQYLLFLDGDDLLHPEAVSRLVHAVADEQETVGLTGFEHFEQRIGDRSDTARIPEVTELLPRLIRQTMGPPACWLFPAHAVRDVGGFHDSVIGLEDWDLQLRVGLRGARLATVPAVGAYYRQRRGQITRNLERMFFAKQRVTLRLHDGIAGRESLLRQWGQDLLKLEYKVLRQSVALGLKNDDRERLLRAIDQLRCAGFTLPAGRPKRLLERVLGARAELVTFNLARLYRPAFFRKYRRDRNVSGTK